MVRAGGHLGRQPHFDLFIDLAVERVIRLRFARRFWTLSSVIAATAIYASLVRQMSLKCRKVPSH
jgi:hypothetical protein